MNEQPINQLQPTEARTVVHYRTHVTCTRKEYVEDTDEYRVRLEDLTGDLNNPMTVIEFFVPPGEAAEFEVDQVRLLDAALEPYA